MSEYFIHLLAKAPVVPMVSAVLFYDQPILALGMCVYLLITKYTEKMMLGLQFLRLDARYTLLKKERTILKMKLNEVHDENIKVVCGFPGVGKTTLFNQLSKKKQKVLDSDSSKFDKKDFPENYINHIKKSIKDGYTVLASSHDVVRDSLIDNKIPFILVYPSKELKQEYLKRYTDRGSPTAFNQLLDKNWDKWIKECDSIDNSLVKKIKLKENEYLSLDKIAKIQ